MTRQLGPLAATPARELGRRDPGRSMGWQRIVSAVLTGAFAG